MISKFKRPALAAAVLTLSFAGLAPAQTTQPVAKDDAIFGLSNSNAFRSVKHVKANLAVKDSGTVTGTSWDNAAFMQSVEFDNYNGFRHNAQGNLLGANFGTTAGGGTLATFQTRGITAGQTTPAAGSVFYNFNGQNGSEVARVGGLSISPTNGRIAVTSQDAGATGDKHAKLIVLDYTASAGTGTGASAANYRGIEIPGLRTNATTQGPSRTFGSTWLDSNNVLVLGNSTDGSTTGDLYKVTVAENGSLSQSKVAENLFSNFDCTFTNVTYEPSVSPYVFISGSGFAGSTFNKMIVVDPATWTPVTGLLDFSPATSAGTPDGQINTLRETAFDSKGNLLIGAFIGTTALSDEYGLKSLINAKNVTGLTSQSPNLVGILRKDQTSDTVNGTPPNQIFGTVSPFNGNDVAMSNIDLLNADVGINIESGDYTQQYFYGNVKAQLIAKLKNGKLVATAGAGRGVGYTITPDEVGGSFRVAYALLGDTDLSKKVDFTDLVALAGNYNGTGKVWAQGDFNYDEAVNFTDLVALAANYNHTLSAQELAQVGSSFAADWALAQAFVPEPTTLAFAGGALAVAIRRRRA